MKIWKIIPFMLCGSLVLCQGSFSIVKDIFIGNQDSQPKHFRDLPGNAACFLIDARVNDHEAAVIVSCGTYESTVELVRYPLFPGFSSGVNFFFSEQAIIGNRRLFTIESPQGLSLWSTDGTIEGTEEIHSVDPYLDFMCYFFSLDDQLYFINESRANRSVQLYRTNGTDSGTQLVYTFCQGSIDCFVKTLHDAFVLRDEVAIFFISTPAYGQEPWITDGTSSGTRVLDIRQGSLGSNFLPYIDGVVMNDRLYFPADEGTGIELFATDGTTTYKVKEINPTSGSGFFQTHSQPHAFFAHRDKVFFMANDGIEGFEMWVSDGSEEGTQRLIVTQAGLTERGDIPNYFAFKNRVLFQLSSQSAINSYDLYVSDGTPGGTSLLKDFRYSHEAFVPLLEDENWLYFKAVNSSTGTELWRTNGTESGTSLVKNINTRTPFFNLGLSSSAPFYRLDDRFYFLANSGPTLEADGQIWQSDGNPSHTGPILNLEGIQEVGNVDINWLYYNGQAFFFSASHNGHGYELWKYEEKSNSTIALSDPIVTIFPNPVYESLKIQFSKPFEGIYHAELFCPLGRKLLTTTLESDNNQLQVMHLPTGLYFLVLRQAEKGRNYTLPFIKMQ